jgi:hypothetical protein
MGSVLKIPAPSLPEYLAASRRLLQIPTAGTNSGLTIKINRSEAKLDFNIKTLISGLLHDRVRLDESFPMGPCSTSGDKNSLRYDLGPHHCDCHASTQ